MLVSSTYISTFEESCAKGKSLIKIRKSKGPSRIPEEPRNYCSLVSKYACSPCSIVCDYLDQTVTS